MMYAKGCSAPLASVARWSLFSMGVFWGFQTYHYEKKNKLATIKAEQKKVIQFQEQLINSLESDVNIVNEKATLLKLKNSILENRIIYDSKNKLEAPPVEKKKKG